MTYPDEPARAMPMTTYEEVVGLAQELLAPHPVGSGGSAVAMNTLLEQILGRRIATPGHEHEHRVVNLLVAAKDGALTLNLQVDPCPEGSVVRALAPCPECAAGKHGNCDGNTWDNAADDLGPCPCAGADHRT